jgi:S-DNA-T family DNA segregation ATPase FtsK/SpoIIIE
MRALFADDHSHAFGPGGEVEQARDLQDERSGAGFTVGVVGGLPQRVGHSGKLGGDGFRQREPHRVGQALRDQPVQQFVKGFGPRPGLLRTFHIRKEAGIDQLTPIVNRALAAREAAGIDDAPPTVIEAAPDPLADIAEVMTGHRRMRTQEVLQRLAERNRAVYGSWTFERLTDELPDGAKPYKTGGHMQVAADRVAEALADRLLDAAGPDTDGDDETIEAEGAD